MCTSDKRIETLTEAIIKVLCASDTPAVRDAGAALLARLNAYSDEPMLERVSWGAKWDFAANGTPWRFIRS